MHKGLGFKGPGALPMSRGSALSAQPEMQPRLAKPADWGLGFRV
jgi:hypothetical protein